MYELRVIIQLWVVLIYCVPISHPSCFISIWRFNKLANPSLSTCINIFFIWSGNVLNLQAMSIARLIISYHATILNSAVQYRVYRPRYLHQTYRWEANLQFSAIPHSNHPSPLWVLCLFSLLECPIFGTTEGHSMLWFTTISNGLLQIPVICNSPQ